MTALTFAVGLILGAIAATLVWFGVWVYFGLRASPKPVRVPNRLADRGGRLGRFHPNEPWGN